MTDAVKALRDRLTEWRKENELWRGSTYANELDPLVSVVERRIDELERKEKALKTLESDALREASKHVPWSDGKCSCGVKYSTFDSKTPYEDWSNHILSLIPASGESALSKAIHDREQAASAAALEKAADLLRGKAGDMWYCDRAQEIVRSLIDPPAQSALSKAIQSARFEAAQQMAVWWEEGAGEKADEYLEQLRASVEQP